MTEEFETGSITISVPHGAVVEIQLVELVDPSPISPLKDKDYLKQVSKYPFEKVRIGSLTPVTITRLWPGCRYQIFISKYGYHNYSETFTAIEGELKIGRYLEPLPINDVDIPAAVERKPVDRRPACARPYTASYNQGMEELIRSFEVFPWGFKGDKDYIQIKNSIEHFTCEGCHLDFTWHITKNNRLPPYLRYNRSRRQIIRGKFYCKNCAEMVMGAINYRCRSQIEFIAESLNMNVENCNVAGTCEILNAHHNTFQSDDQRLKTDFLIGTICGQEKLNKYKSKRGYKINTTEKDIDERWNEILNNNKKKLEELKTHK